MTEEEEPQREQRSLISRIKRGCYYVLEDQTSRVREVVNILLMLVVVASIVEMVLEVNPDLTPERRLLYEKLEDVFIAIFLTEYLLRWWICSNFRHDFRTAQIQRLRRIPNTPPTTLFFIGLHAGLRHKIQWMTEPLSIVDLLAILPIFRPFRIFRVLRVLRILKLFRYSKRLSMFGTIMRERAFELWSVAAIAVVVWGMAALAFYVEESGVNEKINTLSEAVYWAIITITTVGYGDITPATDTGRVIAVVGTIFGMSAVVFFTSVIVSALTEQFTTLKEHRMERQIDKMRGHYIVCGYADLGNAVCATLKEERRDFVVVDIDQDRVEAAERAGYVTLRGDVTLEETWSRLGLPRAAGVITALAEEATNVYIILIVKDLQAKCPLVACGTTKDSRNRLLKVGADRVITPFQLGGLQMAQSAIRPAALDFFDLSLQREFGDWEVEEVLVPINSRLKNHELKEAGVRIEFDLILVAIKRESEMIFNPKADTLLHEKDVMILLGHEDDLERLRLALAPTTN